MIESVAEQINSSQENSVREGAIGIGRALGSKSTGSQNDSRFEELLSVKGGEKNLTKLLKNAGRKALFKASSSGHGKPGATASDLLKDSGVPAEELVRNVGKGLLKNLAGSARELLGRALPLKSDAGLSVAETPDLLAVPAVDDELGEAISQKETGKSVRVPGETAGGMFDVLRVDSAGDEVFAAEDFTFTTEDQAMSTKSKKTAAPVKLVVVDLRTGKDASEGGSKGLELQPSLVNVRGGEEDGNIVVHRSGVPVSNGGQSFRSEGSGDTQAIMSRSFQETLNNEIVRHSGIILRNGGEGELRLVLKPENLGSVRILLNLSGDHIEGQIIVENNTIKELFESHLLNLRNAFKEDGFESAALEVSVGNGHARGRGNNRGKSVAEVAEKFDENVLRPEESILGDWLINLTV